MKYDKPEVVELANAASAIQSNEKPSGLPDNESGIHTTVGAYEADE